MTFLHISDFLNTHVPKSHQIDNTSMVKIPKILSPILAPKYGDLRGFPPQNPHKFSFPHPQSIPEPMKSSNPTSIPKKRGILGINPKRSPKFKSCPSPKYTLFLFNHYPHPQWGFSGTGKIGFFGGQTYIFCKKFPALLPTVINYQNRK